ncbi:MAG: 2-oxoacid:acceptor oxidoreductase subunit alpha [Bdellovibrionota bacterium]
MSHHETVELNVVVIRFAGDSGDGMQLVGDQFTSTSAMMDNEVATLPDYPAEIRAPAGTVSGVSGFQLSFGSSEVFTPGDRLDVLVAMNPPALKVNLHMVKENGIIIVNEDSFNQRSVEKAGYAANPLDSGELKKYRVCRVPMTSLTQKTLSDSKLSPKQVDRCKNFFALGLCYWLFNRSKKNTADWLEGKFKAKPDILAANIKALEAGFDFGDKNDVFKNSYVVRKKERSLGPGTYRHVTGNSATALGLMAAARRAGLPLFLGSYPITPATDIMQHLSRYREFAKVFQAEDEIAAVGSAVGAAFGGALAATTTSGPGFSLKSEFINLAVITELPLIIVDVQRAGPSTGLPTKTEQSDLFQALWGRHGESPIAVLAAASSRDCFDITLEAARIALKYMTPVVVLTDGYLGNGSEVWKIPDLNELPEIKPGIYSKSSGNFMPYERDLETLARPWAVPGTPGFEHRIGGLEKEDVTGVVSHSPVNHEKMVKLRAEKIARIANDIPSLSIYGDQSAKLLVLGWGSTRGVIKQAVQKLWMQGVPVACAHLRHLNPMPKDLKQLLTKFPKVLVPENNAGQLWYRLRAEYLMETERLNKIQGQPFRADEIETKIRSLMGLPNGLPNGL